MVYWVLLLLSLLFLFGQKAKSRKVVNLDQVVNGAAAGTRTEYDLYTFKAPRVTGLGLHVAVFLLEVPIIADAITWLLFRRNKFHCLRHLKMSCQPTYYPLVHDFKKDVETDNHHKLSVDQFLQQELAKVLTPIKEHKSGTASVIDYARAYASGSVLPSKIAQQVLACIKTSDAQLRYVLQFNPEDIMQQARLSDSRILSGKPISILDGVPVLVKDEFDVSGLPTTCGTTFYSEVATEDATIAHRLRSHGAILIGKSNMVELGLSAKGVNPHYGTPRNPHNIHHHTGGSSAGSAGAVASGLVPIATAADIGGSIRIPAGLCGVVGLKPTFGRVSHHGSFPLSWTLGHAGPIGNSVRDCAVGYAMLAGVDHKDNKTEQQPGVIIPNFDIISSAPYPLQGIRIGIYSPWVEHATPEIVKSVQGAVEVLSSLGAEIVETTVLEGIFEYSRLAHTMVLLSEMRASVSSYFDYGSARSKFGLDSRLTLSVSKPLTATDYLQANCVRTLAIQSIKRSFTNVDLIVTPTTAITAPRINTPDGKEEVDVRVESLLMRYVFVGNFVGIPAITLPCGYTPEGLPIGVQLLGRWWEEHLLLKAAFSLETRLSRRDPSISFDHLSAARSSL